MNLCEINSTLSPEIISLLEKPYLYHYKQQWLSSTNEIERKYLELFTFGTIRHLYRNEFQLTSPMYEKLQKLTIISLSEQHCEMQYDLVEQECKLRDSDQLEHYLIELQDIIHFKLDPIEKHVTIIKMFDCRDVYAYEHPLLVVNDLKVSNESLLRDLQRWKQKLKKKYENNDFSGNNALYYDNK